MIKAPNSYLKNFAFFAVMGILFFTPVGKTIKATILEWISTAPSVEHYENQQVITQFSGYVTNANGTIFPFESFRNKPILVSFWASWCSSCVAELPSLQKLYNDYKHKVNFVLISVETPEKLGNFMQKKELTMPVYFNETHLPQELFSKSIPATFLISPNGRIVIKQIGVANWNSSQVRKVINQMLSK